MEYIQPNSATPEYNLKTMLAILWRHKWVASLVFATAIGITYYLTARMEKLYRADAQVLLVNRGTTTSNSLEMSLTAPMVETVETQMELLKTPEMAEKTYIWLKNAIADRTDGKINPDSKIYDELVNDSRVWRKFRSLLKVSNPENTGILVITITHNNPNKAAALAQAVCKAFEEWKRQKASVNIQLATASLTDRTKAALTLLEKAEEKERSFKKKRKLVDVSTQSKTALELYLSRDAEVATLKQDLNSQSKKIKFIEGRLREANKAILDKKSIRSDEYVVTLQSQLKQLEVERYTASLKFTDKYPGVLSDLDARIADIKQRLNQAIEETINSTVPSLQAQGALGEEYKQAQAGLIFTLAKLDAAVKMRDQAKKTTRSLPDTNLQYARLVREVDLARSLYTGLKDQSNRVGLSTEMVAGNVQTITEKVEVPETPFQPDWTKNLLIGGSAGLAAAFLLSLLLESSQNRLRRVEDIERLVPGPIVAALPAMSRRETQRMIAGDTMLGAEVYGLARANLAFALRQPGDPDPWKHRVLMVTSAVPGEGKSLTAAHLARSLARAGKSVILIDADLRRPTLNRLFHTEETVGLADVLAGKARVEDVLFTTDTENLWLMHSGIPIQNPTEMISLPQMKNVLETLKAASDVVIIDTPACAVVADALFLVPYADCVMHVIAPGQAPEDVVQQSIRMLNSASPRAMTFFVNRAPKEKRHGYARYYNYNTRMAMAASSEVTVAQEESSVEMPPSRQEIIQELNQEQTSSDDTVPLPPLDMGRK